MGHNLSRVVNRFISSNFQDQVKSYRVGSFEAKPLGFGQFMSFVILFGRLWSGAVNS